MTEMTHEEFAMSVFKKARELKDVRWDNFKGIDDEQIRLNQDLGLSSLDVMEIIIELEEIYGFKVDDSRICNIYTLSDLWNVVKKASRNSI